MACVASSKMTRQRLIHSYNYFMSLCIAYRNSIFSFIKVGLQRDDAQAQGRVVRRIGIFGKSQIRACVKDKTINDVDNELH